MKKFRFSMEKLLSYKGQMLDSEMMTLAVLNNMLTREQLKLYTYKNELNKCKSELETKMKEQTTPAECQSYVYYEKHLKDQIRLSEKKIADINKQRELQLSAVKNLKLETKSLETIKESKFNDYKKEDLKRTELIVDEFVSTARIMNMNKSL